MHCALSGLDHSCFIISFRVPLIYAEIALLGFKAQHQVREFTLGKAVLVIKYFLCTIETQTSKQVGRTYLVVGVASLVRVVEMQCCHVE